MTVADDVEFTVVRLTQDEVNDVRQRATSSAAHVLALVQMEGDELRERSESSATSSRPSWHRAGGAAQQFEESRTRLEQQGTRPRANQQRNDLKVSET